jgi:cyclic pyranopterin phosphate synthase
LRDLIRGVDAPLTADTVSDEALRRVVAAIWRQRGDRYSEIRTVNTARAAKVEMSYIGG